MLEHFAVNIQGAKFFHFHLLTMSYAVIAFKNEHIVFI